MSNLWAQESYVDRIRNSQVGESDVYETSCETRGELYRRMRQEYGRCTGKVYIDGVNGDLNGKARAIGWVFVKSARYEDTQEHYLAETWVTVHTGPPTRTVRYAYA